MPSSSSLRTPTGRIPYGSGTPVCGRKHCKRCGRWRPAVDYPAEQRTERGVLLRLSSECYACKRQREREIKATREGRERYRERQRLHKAVQRRLAGVPERRRAAPYHATKVPNAAVREAFLASDLKLADVVRRIGWKKTETSRLARALGLMVSSPTTKGGKHYPGRIRTTMHPDDAAKVLRALDVDPVDVGL